MNSPKNLPPESLALSPKVGNLRNEICSFFKIDITRLSPEKIHILNEFSNWISQSLVFSTKTKTWKYKNLGKEEVGSFTFPIYKRDDKKGSLGLSSLAHMLHGGDPNVPWTHFDFDTYEKGFLKFVREMEIPYEDAAAEVRRNHGTILRQIRDTLGTGDIDKIAELCKQGEQYMFYRSSCMDFLAHFGLGGLDSEGCVALPPHYTDI